MATPLDSASNLPADSAEEPQKKAKLGVICNYPSVAEKISYAAVERL